MNKKQIIPLIGLISLMVACSNGNGDGAASPNTIAEAELTEREEYMLFATSDQSFVYDFNLGNDSKEASIWIEKYEFGELIESHLSRMWTDVEGSGFILFTFSDTHINPREKAINMGVYGESGGGGGTSIDEIIGEEADTEMTTWASVVTDETDIPEGEILLGSYSISMEGNSMQSLSPEFYEDIEGNLEEIEDYAAVYIFKAEFNEVDDSNQDD